MKRPVNIYAKILIPALMVYAMASLFRTGEKAEAAMERRQELRREAQALAEEVSELWRRVESADDPAVIAEVARSELGLVLPGDKVIYDLGN